MHRSDRRDDEGLILPKKIINPCLESKNRQDLHRELVFNTKIGKNVLNQKTELQKALQKQKERISQSHNREDHSSSSTNQGLGQELAQEIARRNVRNIEGNSSKADESEALNEEYLRIKSSLKHNRINSSDI